MNRRRFLALATAVLAFPKVPISKRRHGLVLYYSPKFQPMEFGPLAEARRIEMARQIRAEFDRMVIEEIRKAVLHDEPKKISCTSDGSSGISESADIEAAA